MEDDLLLFNGTLGIGADIAAGLAESMTSEYWTVHLQVRDRVTQSFIWSVRNNSQLNRVYLSELDLCSVCSPKYSGVHIINDILHTHVDLTDSY